MELRAVFMIALLRSVANSSPLEYLLSSRSTLLKSTEKEPS